MVNLCIDCKYHVLDTDTFHYCVHDKSPVTGEALKLACTFMRVHTHNCGPSGMFFVHKNTPKQSDNFPDDYEV